MKNLCVVLGNGPSLKGFDLRRLSAEHSLGMNAAYRYWDEIDWYPTYYSCLDDQLIISHHDEIYRLWKEGRIQKFFVHGSFFEYHPDCICTPEFFSLDQVLPHWYKNRGKSQGWTDLSNTPAFRTSDTTKITTGAFATRFAAHMGHDVLALMGIDLKYVEILPEAEATEGVGLVMKETPKSNPNYFFDSYQQAGDKYNVPNPDVHGNELHIQSFRLVKKDFESFGQKTQIYNTNPNSLLEDEKVFELRSIDRLLIPHDLAAVVVPTTEFEIDALLANFDIWNIPDYSPRSATDIDNRCALIFMFNNRNSEQYETAIRQKFLDTGMERHFSYLGFEYLDLEGDDDLYERDYKRKVGEQGFKSGPNNQFFKTMQRARGLGRYVFQMETDCVPLRRGWLTELRRLLANSDPAWIIGSLYHGVETLSPSFKNHLNGNAIYAVGDPGFQNFLDTFWEPRTRQMVRDVDRRLAYDCILDKIFTEQKESDPEVQALLADHRDKFRPTEFILNISGKRDLEELSPNYRTLLLEKFTTAFILHNRTAQKWVADQAAASQTPTMSSHPVPIDHPRLLIIDMTPMGNGTATGEVKSNLLGGWPQERLLQVAANGNDGFALVRPNGAGGYDVTPTPHEEMLAALEAFRPEIVLYRPLVDKPYLHDFAMSYLDQTDVPLVTWLMDDWPARLFAEDKVRFAPMDRDLQRLLKRSALRLSICDAMSRAFAKRYGVPFVAYANGIAPDFWPDPAPQKAGPTVLRYAGGLAPDMNSLSVQRVAQAVEDLAKSGVDIRFEINTQSWWKVQSGHLFDGFKATTIESVKRSFSEYVQWLREADCLLIAYNFDHASLQYVRYSMANKTPECLASGAAILAHGPRDVATVDYLAETGAAQIVDRADKTALKTALLALTQPETREGLVQRARKLALERHSLPVLEERFARQLEQCRLLPPETAFPVYLYKQDELEPERVEDPDLITARLEDCASGIMVYDDPVAVLAEAMQKGDSPSAVLEEWAARANVALALMRANRNKLVLVERSRLLVAPKAMRLMLREMFPERHLPTSVRFRMKAATPLLYGMGMLFFRQNQPLQRVLSELRASSSRPEGIAESEAPDLVKALAQFHELTGAKKNADGKERGLASALAQLSEVQSELQALDSKVSAQIAKEKAVEDMREQQAEALRLQQEQTAQLQAALENYERERQEQKESLQLRQNQIVQLQATVEAYYREAENLRGLLTEKDRALDERERQMEQERAAHHAACEELRRLYDSKSWRVTEPLRGIRRVVGISAQDKVE